MILMKSFVNYGNWLFRYRSYIPFALLPMIIMGLLFGRFSIENSFIENTYIVFCILLSLFGFLIRIITIGHIAPNTSGRNTKKQKAEVLNNTGIYSVMRHPLYVGNFFMQFGLILLVQSIWLDIIFILFFWLYYEKIMYAEEHFLIRKFGQEYLSWASKTPAIIPDFKLYVRPKYKFSWRRILNREYSGFFGIVLSFLFVVNIITSIEYGKIVFTEASLIILILSFILYLSLRFLRKYKNYKLVKEKLV